jgi:hypothetical protein
MLVPYTTRHIKIYNSVQVDHVTVWPGKLHSDCSPLLSLVALLYSRRCSSLHVLSLSTSYNKLASIYGLTVPVPTCLGFTGQMSNVVALLKVDVQLKVTENGQSISLQLGITSKNGKSKKCLELLSDSKLFPFCSGSLAVLEICRKPCKSLRKGYHLGGGRWSLRDQKEGGGGLAEVALSRACHKEGGDASGAPTLSLPTTWVPREPLFVRHSLFGLLPPRHYTWQGLKKKSAIREQHIQFPPE